MTIGRSWPGIGGLPGEKDQAARTIVELLDRRFPGLAQQVEMTDVATPLTFERYTGNWQGSFEGWLITPDNSHTMMKPMSRTLPGLGNFYMCGQWVEPRGWDQGRGFSGRVGFNKDQDIWKYFQQYR